MSLPSIERQAVNAQITQALSLEEKGEVDGYTFDRDGSAYNGLLLGLGETMHYVAKLPSNLVVDVGCGTSRAIYDLSRTYGALGLRFRATTLKRYKAHDRYLGASNIDVDTVEVLRSYRDGSVGCFLAVFSLAYSKAPKIAIRAIKEKLCRGGVLKAVFQNQYVPGKFGEQPMTDFYNACLEYGLDVVPMYPDEYGPETMLALKKPTVDKMTARQLIESDFQGMMEMIRGPRKK